ncbi:helix-turn-helix domain-containing protein [Larkinella terrae]|uniref:Helix-turn-helix domain-containing protein n=1 Tax=Larkinella terrae TaxID=2025311 RepID=A0A7K0ENR9_9BACT|nr:helix-turn-helix domain-containing protein [Larkinella terrae]MRS63372.1 helix-turn-helix domain-containing protein [Larkinella terrae]
MAEEMILTTPAQLKTLLVEAVSIALKYHQPTDNVITDQIGGIEVAEQITRLSKARIYTLVSERAIPHKKRGNRLYFNRTELIAWVEQGNRKERGGPEI